MSRPVVVSEPDSSTDPRARLQRERDLYGQALAEMTVRYEQKIQELSVLRRMSDTLRDCTDLDEVFRRLLLIVLEELPTTACSLYLADDSGELALRARCIAGGPVEILRPGQSGAIRVRPGAGPLGQTFASGEVGVHPAVAEATPGWYPAGIPGLLAAPLGPPEGCIGVLALHERQIEDVAEDHARLLPILATQATVAIENAILYQRLKQHSDILEVRVRERTAALEHLNAELQAAARQRSQFFAQFSHELRTPLNSILGFSEMLQIQIHGPLTEGQARCARHVHESGTRLLRLINDILDLAKVEAGKLTLHVQPVSLSAAAEEAVAVMLPQVTAKHLQVTSAIPRDLPRVLGDPSRIHQILLNLLSNAVKFTPEGGSISVSAERRGSPDGLIEVAVRDTGIGIAPEDQGRLFQDFEQAGGARHRGTGLGLSLTRRLVALHGGTVGLSSAPGEGSRFWFTLPMDGGVGDARPREMADGSPAG